MRTLLSIGREKRVSVSSGPVLAICETRSSKFALATQIEGASQPRMGTPPRRRSVRGAAIDPRQRPNRFWEARDRAGGHERPATAAAVLNSADYTPSWRPCSTTTQYTAFGFHCRRDPRVLSRPIHRLRWLRQTRLRTFCRTVLSPESHCKIGGVGCAILRMIVTNKSLPEPPCNLNPRVVFVLLQGLPHQDFQASIFPSNKYGVLVNTGRCRPRNFIHTAIGPAICGGWAACQAMDQFFFALRVIAEQALVRIN